MSEGIHSLASLGIVSGRRAVCLVDGQHYPPVLQWALEEVQRAGAVVAAVAFLGGSEKVGDRQPVPDKPSFRVVVLDVIRRLRESADAVRSLAMEVRADVVLDLSDEPVLDLRSRMVIASAVLTANVAYAGADFVFLPHANPPSSPVPGIRIVGSGKRAGKTAVSVTVARQLTASGVRSAILAMGRGGPEEPEVLEPATVSTDPEDLLRVAEQGRHAASDYWEDAVLAGVPAVGCRRCGGGLAGAPFVTNVSAGLRRLEALPIDVVLLEGSGPTIPPAHADAGILVVNAGEPSWSSVDYLGEVRVREADVVVMTMCEPPSATPDHVDHVYARLRAVAPHVPIVRTVFRGEPVCPVRGAAVCLASTSAESGSARAVHDLEARHGCHVVGHTANLSHRSALERDLERELPRCDLLLTELKAASVDMAVEMALKQEKRVVFLHNRPVVVGGDYPDFSSLVGAIWEKAASRWEAS